MAASWIYTYEAYLRSQDYTIDEIKVHVITATDVVSRIPKPYKTRVLNLLKRANRDDFSSVDFSLLASLFDPTHPIAYEVK